LEGFLPDFLGEVGLDSIEPGFGGEEGLTFLDKDDLEARFQQLCEDNPEFVAKLSPPNKLKQCLHKFHVVLRDFLLRDENAGCRHALLFFKSSDGNLINLVSFQAFSLSDSEHFICKLDITVTMSTSSRTISENKHCWEKHCHPVPGNPEYLKWLEGPFLLVRQSCYALHANGWLKAHASEQLQYFSSFYMDDVDATDDAHIGIVENADDEDSSDDDSSMAPVQEQAV